MKAEGTKRRFSYCWVSFFSKKSYKVTSGQFKDIKQTKTVIKSQFYHINGYLWLYILLAVYYNYEIYKAKVSKVFKELCRMCRWRISFHITGCKKQSEVGYEKEVWLRKIQWGTRAFQGQLCTKVMTFNKTTTLHNKRHIGSILHLRKLRLIEETYLRLLTW